jgi:chromosome segregation ATPase
MNPSTEQIRQQLHDSLQSLRTLRDEIRVDLHLAGMDAKDKWRQLEPRIEEAERFAREVSETSRTALEEIVTKFRAFRESLKRHHA